MAGRRHGARRLSPPDAPWPAGDEVSSGGLVYRRRAGRVFVVLVARRQPTDGRLAWGLPKGHAERGETLADAAVREVREETGLEVVIEDHLGDVTYWYVRRGPTGPRRRVRKRVRFFLMRWRGGRFADRDHEMDAVHWFPLTRADAAIAYDNERRLLAAAQERLEPTDH